MSQLLVLTMAAALISWQQAAQVCAGLIAGYLE